MADTALPLPPTQNAPRRPEADPLLFCLHAMARLCDRPASFDALSAGLPLGAEGFSADLYLRAAERVGLSARVAERALDEIPDTLLPVVLLLDGGGACVWLARNADGTQRVLQPESGGEAEISLDALRASFTGTVLFTRASLRHDARVESGAVPRAEHWFWGVFTRAWPIYGEVVVASVMINLFALVMPLFTMNVYDRVVPNRIMETLWALTIGVLIVIAFELLMRLLRGYFIDIAGRRIDVILSATIFEKVLDIRMDSRPSSVGVMANNLQEFEAFREFLTSATIATLVDLPFVLLFVAALFWIGGPLAWVVVLAIPLILGMALALQRPIARVMQRSLRLSAQRQATLVESLMGLETIKTLGAAAPLQRKWEQLAGQIAALGLRARLLSSGATHLSNAAQQLTTLGVVVAGVYLIAADGLTTGSLIACTILAGRALAPLGQAAQLLTRWYQCKVALGSLNSLMALPVERPRERAFLDRPRVRGAVEFRKLSFRYPAGQADTLSEVSFRIVPGERVAFLGRVGSGKSTIAKLILGLYHGQEGAVLIDGTDIRQLDPTALRRDVGYVPQDLVLFHGSLKENLAYGAPQADDAAILRAARIGGVSEFADLLPQGLDLPIGERGDNLSGGQRQAVAIARAELLAPPLLVMDEPSSAMDKLSEEQFKARLRDSLDGRTLILITHRSSLLSLVDRLIVLDRGKVVADGPKDRVIAALAGGRGDGSAR